MPKTWKSLEEIVSKDEWICYYYKYVEDISVTVGQDVIYEVSALMI